MTFNKIEPPRCLKFTKIQNKMIIIIIQKCKKVYECNALNNNTGIMTNIILSEKYLRNSIYFVPEGENVYFIWQYLCAQ